MAKQRNIRTLDDLCAYWHADEPSMLNTRVYANTDCGASISILLTDGRWLHNGDDWTGVRKIAGFKIQTILEGMDAMVGGHMIALPVSSEDIDQYVQSIQDEYVQSIQDEVERIEYHKEIVKMIESQRFLTAVGNELARVRDQYPPIHSTHEGFSIIHEAFDTLKAEVWRRAAHHAALRRELVQLAAMCARMAVDLGLDDGRGTAAMTPHDELYDLNARRIVLDAFETMRRNDNGDTTYVDRAAYLLADRVMDNDEYYDLMLDMIQKNEL